MTRHTRLIIGAFGLVAVLAYAVSASASYHIAVVYDFREILFPASVETALLVVALVALIAVAWSAPAPVRSFWHRLMARTRDPVPSTT